MLVHARFAVGDLAESLAVADELVARRRSDGDRPGELRALLARTFVAHLAEATEISETRPLVEEAIAVFGGQGDDAGLGDAWLLAAENLLQYSKIFSLRYCGLSERARSRDAPAAR